MIEELVTLDYPQRLFMCPSYYVLTVLCGVENMMFGSQTNKQLAPIP